MATDFAETYGRKSNDELLRLVGEKDSLQETARHALDCELNKRGLGEGDVADLEKREKEESRNVADQVIIKQATRGNWLGTLVTCAISFAAAAVLTVVLADYIFKPPSGAVQLLTIMSLRAGLAIALLTSAFASRWLTFKRIVVSAVVFSIVLFAFIAYIDITARH